MLKVDLSRLSRDRSVRVEAEVPADDPFLQDSDLAFEEALRVDLTASETTSGQVVVRGSVRGILRQECRRCLAEVRTPVDESLTLVYAPPDELGEDGGDEIRTLEPGVRALDLAPAIREELILAVDPYVVCDAECKGLCPLCGTNLNEETCDCTLEEADPRWDALRALKNE